MIKLLFITGVLIALWYFFVVKKATGVQVEGGMWKSAIIVLLISGAGILWGGYYRQ